jgi:hypothetical protein
MMLHPTMPRPNGSFGTWVVGVKQYGESAEQGVYLREVTLSSDAVWPRLAHGQSSSETMIRLSSLSN